MEETEYIALIEWYCRQNYYNTMLAYVKQARDAYPTSEQLRLLLCLAYALTNRYHEAIKEGSNLLDYADYTLAALLAQNVACMIHGNEEKNIVIQIETRIKEERRKASYTALCLASSVLVLSRKADIAKEYIDKAYKLKPTNLNVLLIKGWVESILSYENASRVEFFFNSVLKEEPKNLNALLGLATIKQRSGNHSEAISILNSLTIRYPKLPLPLIEKIKCLLAIKDWEQVLELINRTLSIESNNLDAIKASSVMAFCRDSNPNEGLRQLQLFLRNLLLAEPKNVYLLIENLQLFSHIAFQDQGILSELSRCAEKMLQVVSNSTELMIELGNLYVALGNSRDAERWYKNAIQMDESSFAALMGLARCRLLEGSSEAMELARQQMDFLMEIQPHSTNVQLLVMSAKISSDNSVKALDYLNMAANTLLKRCEKFLYGYEYLKELKPDLCLEIAKHRLMHSLNKSLKIVDNKAVSDTIDKEPCIRLLEELIDACPNCSDALLLLSKVRMQSGDYEGALSLLRKLLDTIESSNAQAHLLMAQILVYQGKYELASQSLEVGLSHNFKIREEPIYHLIVGMVQKHSGDLENCIKSCQIAMSLAGLESNRKSDIPTPDKATLYLELITAYSKVKRFAEALALVEEAKMNIAETSEQGRLIIGNAEVYLDMGELDNAISCLYTIIPGQPYYLEAHTRLAEIYLNYRKDRQAFAKCFRY